jgi:outer membrane protein OmpA-like peptidoglycan-associated protein
VLFFSNYLFAQNTKETITVFFDSNNFSLKLEEKDKLISFFSNENTIVESISIKGYCDDIGSSEDNYILSKNRANSVATFIKTEFNSILKSLEGKGEIALSNNSSVEQERKNNRKATLEILYSKSNKNSDEDEKTTKDAFSNYKSFSDDLKVGDKIIIDNLLFVGSLTVFEYKEDAEQALQKIVAYLKNNPSYTIEIQGHVCCISASFKDAYDRDSGKNNLSETRAEKIYDYIIEKGISSERMTHKGYGRQFPILGADEQFNKRVEILITKI